MGKPTPNSVTPTSRDKRQPDWWARVVALFGVALAIVSFVYTIKKDRTILRQSIQPQVECFITPRTDHNYDLTFELMNESPISIASVSVDFHPLTFSRAEMRVVATGVPHTRYSHVPGFSWLTAQELGPNEVVAKAIESNVLTTIHGYGTAAVFEVTYYRPADMRPFRERCIFFVNERTVSYDLEYRERAGYLPLLHDIDEAVALKRKSREELIRDLRADSGGRPN